MIPMGQTVAISARNDGVDTIITTDTGSGTAEHKVLNRVSLNAVLGSLLNDPATPPFESDDFLATPSDAGVEIQSPPYSGERTTVPWRWVASLRTQL